MSSQLQREEASVRGLQGELQAQTTATSNVLVRVADLEMCAYMTGKQLEAAQWIELWAATREQTQMSAGQLSTSFWTVGQELRE